MILCMYAPDCTSEAVGKCSGCERHVCHKCTLYHEAACGYEGLVRIGETTRCDRCKHERKSHNAEFDADECEGVRKNDEPCRCPGFISPLQAYRGAAARRKEQ